MALRRFYIYLCVRWGERRRKEILGQRGKVEHTFAGLQWDVRPAWLFLWSDGLITSALLPVPWKYPRFFQSTRQKLAALLSFCFSTVCFSSWTIISVIERNSKCYMYKMTHIFHAPQALYGASICVSCFPFELVTLQFCINILTYTNIASQLTHCWLGIAMGGTSAMAPRICSVRPWFFSRAFILPS